MTPLPGGNLHEDAVCGNASLVIRALNRVSMRGHENYIVEADIVSFLEMSGIRPDLGWILDHFETG